MKKLIAIAALLAFCFVASAQTNTPPTLPTQILGYFTAFNTNLSDTFGNNNFDLWSGADSFQNAPHPLLNEIGASYDLYEFARLNTNAETFFVLSAEIVARNEGVAGSFVSGQGGFGISAVIWDTKATVYVDGGTYLGANSKITSDDLFAEIGVRVKKALGHHAYGGLDLGVQLPRNSQYVGVIAGVTF